MDNNQPIVLIKFQDEPYVKPFYEQGSIYMNPLSYFQTIDDDHIRGDKLENSTHFLQSHKISTSINKQLVPTVEAIILYNPCDDIDKFTHIFCMSSLCHGDYLEKDEKIFDERVFEFGNHLVIIHNLKKFFIQLISSLKQLKKEKKILAYKTDRINYFDPANYHGKTDAFDKSARYSWQKEWRVAIRTPPNFSNKPFQFKIGKLNDISAILKTNQFKNKVKYYKNKQDLIF